MPPLQNQYMRIGNLSPTETDRKLLDDAAGAVANTATTAGFGTSTTRRFIQFVPITANTATATPAPNGKGWKIDNDTMGSQALVKRVIPAGIWTFRLLLSASTAQISNDTRCRVFVSVVNGTSGSGTPITGLNGLDSAAVALAVGTTELVWASGSLGEVEFQANDTMLVEFWVESVGVTLIGQTLTLTLENATTPTRTVLPANIVTRYLTSYTGASSSNGSLTRQPQKVLVSAIASSSLLVRFVSAFYGGALTPTGVSLKRPGTRYTGSAASAGQLIRRPGKRLTSSITPGPGTLIRRPGLRRAGAVTSSGVLQRFVSMFKVGALTPTGAVFKRYLPIPKTGSITPGPGVLTRQPIKLLQSAIASSGTMQALLRKNFVSTLTMSGAVTKKLFTFFGGSLAPVGDLTKTTMKYFAGFFYSTSGDGGSGPPVIVKKIVQVIFDD